VFQDQYVGHNAAAMSFAEITNLATMVRQSSRLGLLSLWSSPCQHPTPPLSKNAGVVQRGALHHQQVQGGCAIFAFWINL
jgi:hypothetical protein